MDGAQNFNYYDDWQNATLTCPKCGWTGTFEEGSVEYYDAVMDSSCPVCDMRSRLTLAIVVYPTIEESEGHWDKLSKSEKRGIIARKEALTAWEASKLTVDTELPELDGKSLILTWDFEVKGSDQFFTVIRHEGREIWKEPAVYEGFNRFAEVATILKRKYGSRLVDIKSTEQSEIYLYGDKMWAIDFIKKVRKSIRDSR